MSGGENQRVLVTKRMLREGLLRLMKEKDIDKIKITELCQESGVNRATFYRHYELPRDVLMEMEEELVREVRAALSVPRTLREYEQYAEALFTYLLERKEQVLAILAANQGTDFFTRINALHRDVWNQSIRQHGPGEFDPESVRLVSAYFGGGGYFLVRCWLMEDIQKTPRELAALVIRMVTLSGEMAQKIPQ